MSDARNSSNSLRGGGAKQTGGSGRTSRGATRNGGSNSKDLLAGQGGMDRQAETKRHLQLQIMSKKLAISVRESLISDGSADSISGGDAAEGASRRKRTEAEYAKHNIPLPDPETAIRKLKAMREFTEDWYDEDFRDRWLEKLHAVWVEELWAEFEAAERAHHAAASQKEPMSMEELEAAIQDLDTPAEERKRLKKKLKARRQKVKAKQKTQDDQS